MAKKICLEYAEAITCTDQQVSDDLINRLHISRGQPAIPLPVEHQTIEKKGFSGWLKLSFNYLLYIIEFPSKQLILRKIIN